MRSQALAQRGEYSFTTTTQGETAATLARRHYNEAFDRGFALGGVELAQHKQILRTERAMEAAMRERGDDEDAGNMPEAGAEPGAPPVMSSIEERLFTDKVVRRETQKQFSIAQKVNMFYGATKTTGNAGLCQRVVWTLLGNGRINLWAMAAWYYLSWILCTTYSMWRLEPRLWAAAGIQGSQSGAGGSETVIQDLNLGSAPGVAADASADGWASLLATLLPYLSLVSVLLYTTVLAMPAGEVEWHEDIVEATPERIAAARQSGLVSNPEEVGRDGVIW